MFDYFHPLNDAEFCMIDTETTEFTAGRNGIIEIGIVFVKNLKISAKNFYLLEIFRRKY